jgi:hypothetical protein
MAAPNSGLIKFSGIAAELVNDDYDDADFDDVLTLKDMSVGGNANGSSENFESINSNSEYKPDSSAPYKMSEFYSYDHDAAGSSLNEMDSSPVQSKAPCNYGTNLPNTLYHDGSGTWPEGSDTIYTDSSGTNTAESGNYKVGVISTYKHLVVGSNGSVTSITNCP